jgi:hypothetical protein
MNQDDRKYGRADRALALACAVAVCITATAGSGWCGDGHEGIRAGHGQDGPWWMAATALTNTGDLALKEKPWWPRAAALAVGEQAIIESTGPAAGRMMVRRERLKNRSGKQLEAIVWILDDDNDGSLRTGGDHDSDCYVVDYHGDGTVDRMVDYIDNDADDDPDEMDIRYFVDGQLRYTWFGMDLDDDNVMWSLRGYEYGGPSFFESDPYGDGMVYMNKLNTDDGTWSPVSECPFAFYDIDGDGASEVVVRASAVPIGYDKNIDPDYANDYNRFRAPWSPEMRDKGIVNIRYSFDVDALSDKKTPLHYEMGFNLVGATPYDFPDMHHYNQFRRPPQTTVVTPWKQLRSISDHFEARETGFTWHEQFDDTIAVGYAEHELDDYRWEGVFWIWERRFMENTGGPCQKWNVRREWSNKTSTQRQLYYSGVDQRIHLFGAEEGWIEIGHFAGMGAMGEVRMFDTDGNGYFDRWEVHQAGRAAPIRVTTVRDEKAQRLTWDLEEISQLYTTEILPRAMKSNRKLMAAMQQVWPFEIPAELATAMEAGAPSFRRYAQDVAREMHYQKLREELGKVAQRVIREYKKVPYHLGDLHRAKDIETTANSHTAWLMVRALQRLEVAYGQGDLDHAATILQELPAMLEPLKAR